MAYAEEGIRRGSVNAVTRQVGVPLLCDRPASQKFGEQVGRQISQGIKQRQVAGDPEPPAHKPKGLQIEEDQGTLETSEADGIELRCYAYPEIVLGIQLRGELPDV